MEPVIPHLVSSCLQFTHLGNISYKTCYYYQQRMIVIIFFLYFDNHVSQT
jgi:hypothetical protein